MINVCIPQIWTNIICRGGLQNIYNTMFSPFLYSFWELDEGFIEIDQLARDFAIIV